MMQVIKCTVSGHVVSEDVEVVARAVQAIRRRRLAEVEVRFAPARQGRKVVPLRFKP